METINSATSAVKTALFGESGQNTTTDNTTTGSNTGTTGSSSSGTFSSGTGHTEKHKSMIDDTVTESKPYSGKYESDPMAEDSYNADRDRDKVPQGPQSTGGAPQGANVTGDNDTNENSMSNSNEPNTGFGAGAQPSVGADPSSGQKPREKHQGSDKPNEDPDDATGGGSSGGPSSGGSGGPGANAGGGGSTGPGGMKLPDEDNKSKEEGTGTKYEKSTGLQADGGDFDATRPGAAREADRLMAEAGIKHGETPGKSGEPEKKEKKWYGVDHSGFGGHGSHSNKDGSGSRKNSSANPDDLPGDNANRKQSTTGTTGTTTTDDDGVDSKGGLGQKVKDKLHV